MLVYCSTRRRPNTERVQLVRRPYAGLPRLFYSTHLPLILHQDSRTPRPYQLRAFTQTARSTRNPSTGKAKLQKVWRVFCDSAEDVRTTLEQTARIVQFKKFMVRITRLRSPKVKISPPRTKLPCFCEASPNEADFGSGSVLAGYNLTSSRSTAFSRAGRGISR
jgi:hypothetical protein